jgi:hypothetical protein
VLVATGWSATASTGCYSAGDADAEGVAGGEAVPPEAEEPAEPTPRAGDPDGSSGMVNSAFHGEPDESVDSVAGKTPWLIHIAVQVHGLVGLMGQGHVLLALETRDPDGKQRGQHVHGCRLASPIRPDQAEQPWRP